MRKHISGSTIARYRERDGRGAAATEGEKGNTSIGCLLFSFPLLAPLRISPRRPIGIELHVQLALPPRQLVILGLLLAAERMPLNRQTRRNMERKEKCTSTEVRVRRVPNSGARKTALVSSPLDNFDPTSQNENGQS